MSLHSSDYIRDVVGHVPSAMLSLRSDEVSVFSRMNVQGRRRISLPAKLADITEKVQSEKSDIQESLQASYSQMKSKLDQLEEYNLRLEDQLGNIFNNISNTVNKANKQRNLNPSRHILDDIISDENCEESEQESNMLKPFSSAANNRLDRNQFDGHRNDKVEHKKLILHLEEENFTYPNTSRRKMPYLPQFVETKLLKSTKELKNVIEEETEIDCFPNYRRVKEASKYTNMRGLHRKCENNNQTGNFSQASSQPTKKPPQPLTSKNTQRSRSTGANTFTLRSQSAEQFPIKYKPLPTNQIKCTTKKKSALSLDGSEHKQSCELLQKKSGRRFSSADQPFVTLAEAKRKEDSRRRMSTASKKANSEHTLDHHLTSRGHVSGNIVYLNQNQNRLRKSNHIYQRYPTSQTSSMSPSTNKNSTSSSIGESIETLPLSPQEFINLQSESVDEFFLFSEDVLNMEFETVWEELAYFSEDMENICKNTDKKCYHLQAAKASSKWKTLWIYRGI